MREESPWRPRLAEGTTPASERLVAALAEDITDGRLPSGTRLPAHRGLAAALGISTGTVTKAYAILARRGLVKGSPGRGMFAAYHGHDAAGVINLAYNAPPPLLGNAAVSAALAAVARRADAEGLADYGPPGGHLAHRRAVAAWITATGLDLPPEELLLCNGAQHAIAASFLAASGGQPAVLFTEEFTFPGALRYAGLAGHETRPVGTDAEGMHPAALDRALASRARDTHTARRPVIYVTPTLHNPTAATMGRRRRREIVRVARRHDAVIVEDDVYGFGPDRDSPPLVWLAPERVYYVTSASKALSPAVRVGVLRPPPADRDQAAAAVRVLAQPVSPLQCELLAELTRTGIAAEVRSAVRHEGARRSVLAREVLGPGLQAADGGCYHAFLPLPRSLAEAVVLAAASEGVELTSPQSLMACPAGQRSGIRLCLGKPSWDDLSWGLELVRDLLSRTSRVQRAASVM